MDKKKISIKEIGVPKLVILFLAGICLVVLSVPDLFGSKSKTEDNKVNTAITSTQTQESGTIDSVVAEFESRLKKTLKKVEGVGDVEVMITLKSSKEQVVLKDSPYEQENLNETDEAGGSRISSSLKNDEETVLITNGNGQANPYVTKELEALIEGVVVVAEGGGNSKLEVDIVEAVEVLFNVPAHKIKVLPMKSK
ncbi:hypothetical protein [Clostridium sp. Marseille-P299]|uniref:hypothetical protein n=1 Tax=Clostridium sp. Marseille-P299 TaxID=1805477 RepID=UPI00082B79A5|nr:hypothetical protein [Clostridium sp. Marseille-P299]